MLYYTLPLESGNITSQVFLGISGQTFWYISLNDIILNLNLHVMPKYQQEVALNFRELVHENDYTKVSKIIR